MLPAGQTIASGPDSARKRGNELFVAGRYADAAAAYSAGLADAGIRDVERGTLLSNRAAAYLKLGDAPAAAADARAALRLQPCNAKAHARLARALPRGDVLEAPAAVAAAVALLGPHLDAELVSLYAAVRDATADAVAAAAAAASPSAPPPAEPPAGPAAVLPLPRDPAAVALASTWREAAAAAAAGAELVVLQPGVYETALGYIPCSVLGLGGAELRSAGSHVIQHAAARRRLVIANMRLGGTGRAAAACVWGAGAQLSLIGCTVAGRDDVGVLVTLGGIAALEGCKISNTSKQAIEVREGGRLSAARVTVEDCMQGVAAAGGARSVVLRECSILRSRFEGLMLQGTYTNAVSEAQAVLLQRQQQAPLSEGAVQ
jgi:hypothetical protein